MTPVASSPSRRKPKYEALAAVLEERIQSMEAHQALPTEREMLGEFHVSRATVRQAIQLLIQKGLLYNVQGSGTYVANRAVVSKTLHLTGFSEDMRLRGLEPASEVIDLGTATANGEMATKLHVAEGTPLLQIRRLRLADQVPMALEQVFLVASMVNGVELDGRGSLYDQLRENGVTVWRAAQSIDAVNLDAEQAHHLEQAVGAAALRVRRVSFSDRGDAFEYAETIYRGDRYNFDIVVGRSL